MYIYIYHKKLGNERFYQTMLLSTTTLRCSLHSALNGVSVKIKPLQLCKSHLASHLSQNTI